MIYNYPYDLPPTLVTLSHFFFSISLYTYKPRLLQTVVSINNLLIYLSHFIYYCTVHVGLYISTSMIQQLSFSPSPLYTFWAIAT